jgi:hypothetical protein
VLAATLAVALAACAPYVAPWEFTTGEDIAEAERVATLLAQRSGLPELGNSDPGTRKGFDRAANARISSMIVFDVMDPAEQDRIIEILRDIRKSVRKPILVGFVKTSVDRSKPPERAVSWETVRQQLIR